MSIKLLEVNLKEGTIEDSVFVKIPYASKVCKLAIVARKVCLTYTVYYLRYTIIKNSKFHNHKVF